MINFKFQKIDFFCCIFGVYIYSNRFSEIFKAIRQIFVEIHAYLKGRLERYKVSALRTARAAAVVVARVPEVTLFIVFAYMVYARAKRGHFLYRRKEF